MNDTPTQVSFTLIGPGRAGGAVALAAIRAGHRLVGVQPGPSGRIPPELNAPRLNASDPLPPSDLLLVAVRDDAIRRVAENLARRIAPGTVQVVAHLSGARPVADLEPAGIPHGSLHPLQSLPDPGRGAEALAGAWAAVTASGTEAADLLAGFARSLGMRPFGLSDDAKPAYHAAAAAAANFVVTSLGLAADLLASVDLPFEMLGPLVETVVANVFEMGPDGALTGPIARGDVGTVSAQVAAADHAGAGEVFRLLARATAVRAGRIPEMWEVLA